jgi:alkylated DNA repair dioxygenase AlkB
MRKMLSITRPLSIGEIDHGLRRAFRPVALPLNVVRLVCEAQSWLTLDHAADTVTTKVPVDRELALSPLEQRLVALFQQAGPTLSFSHAVRLAKRDGLNPSSIGPYLIHTPIVKRIARDRYALCGSTG